MTTISSRPVDTRPPVLQTGPAAWMKKHLFNTWYNTLLTLVIVVILAAVVWGLLVWVTQLAQWAVIANNLGLFMTGLYPRESYWRAWSMLGVISALGGFTWGVLARHQSTLFGRNVLIGIGVLCAFFVICPFLPLTEAAAEADAEAVASFPTAGLKLVGMVALTCGAAFAGRELGRQFKWVPRSLTFAWFASYFVLLWLLGGGLGLESVRTTSWGGMTLTLLLAITGISLCFPIGVALALGRRSELPVVKGLSTAYIELVRGVPLISILFMGQVLIPLFLPEGVRPNSILRAVIGLTIFSAAYLAENVRAGLQAVPQGQYEAAASMGMNKPLTIALIILPQAIKTAIPAIVGQFISLFQDTTLLGIVGLVELLGISNSILANPSYLGDYAEVYLFLAVLYWVFCYAMSLGSRRIEESLNTGHR